MNEHRQGRLYIPAIIEEAQRTLDTLSPAFTSATSASYANPRQKLARPRQLLGTCIWTAALFVAAADGDIGDCEAILIHGLRRVLDDDYDKARDDALMLSQFRELYRRVYGAHGEGCRSVLKAMPEVFSAFKAYDLTHHTSMYEAAREMVLQVARAIVEADDRSETKLGRLKELEAVTSISVALGGEAPVNAELARVDTNAKALTAAEPKGLDTNSKTLAELLNQLGSLIGLEKVKDDVEQLVNFIRIQQLRRERGLPTTSVSHHLVFYGNPGTGKTTVARLIAQIYSALGILTRGHLVETDRSGLVAGYVGQTALKVKDVAAQAVGGILFIDEAYALGTRDGVDFGQEAIETLLKFMEDHRSDFVVIVAGYPEKMEKLFATNPGLKSRFNRYLRFDDYNPQQLSEIFSLFCNNGGYLLSPSAEAKVARIFAKYHAHRDETFGNARLARNEFESTIQRQANRLAALNHVTVEGLSLIEPEDVSEPEPREISTPDQDHEIQPLALQSDYPH